MYYIPLLVIIVAIIVVVVVFVVVVVVVVVDVLVVVVITITISIVTPSIQIRGAAHAFPVTELTTEFTFIIFSWTLITACMRWMTTLLTSFIARRRVHCCKSWILVPLL